MIVLMRASPEVFYGHAISTFICVGGGVQRLVQISNEMNDVAQRLRAPRPICLRILQNSHLLADRPRHASFLSAILLQRSALRTSRYVDVVPRSVFSFSAHVVCPRR